jgi:hypothetical protein
MRLARAAEHEDLGVNIHPSATRSPAALPLLPCSGWPAAAGLVLRAHRRRAPALAEPFENHGSPMGDQDPLRKPGPDPA